MDINKILDNDWYKTASKEEMRTALMHFEMNVIDRATNIVNLDLKELRGDCLQRCAEDNDWSR